MAFNFKIPILVRKTALSEGGKPDYIVKSVFVNYPIGTHRRVEEATTRFLKQLNKHLKAFALNRERAEDWLWYAFNPADLKLKTVRVTGKAGKQFFNGDVTVITFTVQNSIFVTLPSFNSLIFSISDMKELGIQTETIVLKTLKSWLDDNDYIDIKQYYAIAGEYLTHIEISSSVKYESFNFGETKQTDFFSFFNNTSSFVGSDEIEKVGYSLNDLYPTQLKRAWLRDELVEHLHGILYNGENTPIVIVGSAGVGKKSILQEAVFRYLETHKNKDSDELPKIWHIDPLRVISGMSVVGQWEQRFESILDYVSKRPIENGKHIIDKVLIDNPIALLRIGQSAHNSLHLADVLKHYLEKRSFQLVMIATQQEWKILQEKDRRYADMFQVIRVQEPNIAEAAAMTFELRNTLETEYECIITAQALSLTFDIHKRFMRHRALPGSVADMLRRLANKHKYGQIDYPEVFSEFSQYSGLRENIFDGNIVLEEQEVDKQVEELLVGQPDAVRCISDVVNLVKARLNAPGKPLASLMFIGPTGVGKTQAAKVLSEYLLGSEDRLMRFDMNEYVSADQAMRLIGDMHNPEGLLTGKVRHNPFGIILLDEIEKADPSVLDLLLQVLDDGRLTDSLGRTVDFSNTIIIMTSNLGATEASHRLGFSQENRDDESVYRKAVQNTFRPGIYQPNRQVCRIQTAFV
jgi:ATP-dependent Clp protease ATP-binding subunit ClpC